MKKKQGARAIALMVLIYSVVITPYLGLGYFAVKFSARYFDVTLPAWAMISVGAVLGVMTAAVVLIVASQIMSVVLRLAGDPEYWK